MELMLKMLNKSQQDYHDLILEEILVNPVGYWSLANASDSQSFQQNRGIA